MGYNTVLNQSSILGINDPTYLLKRENSLSFRQNSYYSHVLWINDNRGTSPYDANITYPINEYRESSAIETDSLGFGNIKLNGVLKPNEGCYIYYSYKTYGNYALINNTQLMLTNNTNVNYQYLRKSKSIECSPYYAGKGLSITSAKNNSNFGECNTNKESYDSNGNNIVNSYSDPSLWSAVKLIPKQNGENVRIKKTDENGNELVFVNTSMKIQILDKDQNPVYFIKSSNKYAYYLYVQNNNVQNAVNKLEANTNEIVISNLPEGTYYIKEIEAPDNYELNEEPILFIRGTSTQDIRFADTCINPYRNLRIEKVDSKTGQIITEDETQFSINYNNEKVKFVNLNKNDGEGSHYREATQDDIDVIDTLETYNGKIYIEQINTGKRYYIKEEKAPRGYVKDETEKYIYGSVSTDNSDITYKFPNSKDKTDATITKKDNAYPYNILTDPAKFQVYNETGELVHFKKLANESVNSVYQYVEQNDENSVDTIETYNGKIKLKDILVGRYTLKEIEAPYGYNIRNESTSMYLTYSSSNLYTIYNDKNIGNATISKVDSNNNPITAPAQFEVYDEKQNLIYFERLENTDEGSQYKPLKARNENSTSTIETHNGKIKIKDIILGNYTLKETKAPEGYEIETENISMEITSTSTEKNITVKNVLEGKTEGPVNIVKTDTSGNVINTNGAIFRLYDADNNLIKFNHNGETTENGRVYTYAENGGDYTQLTTFEGKISIPNLPVGNYYLKEIVAPSGYAINKENVAVKVEKYTYLNPVTVKVKNALYTFGQEQYISTSYQKIEQKTNSENIGYGYWTKEVDNEAGKFNYIEVDNKDDIVTYTLDITNKSQKSYNKMVLINKLPYIGDTGVVNLNESRNSEFAIKLAENPNFELFILNDLKEETYIDRSKYKIEYSNSEQYTDADFEGEQNQKWYKNPTEDTKSFRIVFNEDFELFAGYSLCVNFDGKIEKEAKQGQTAWNSFGYRYYIGEEALTPEPAKVGVKLKLRPVITQTKYISTEKNLGYVIEDEKVTYTIVVENSGTVAKDVVIKDEAPEGTTFVPGSIKVNGNSIYEGEDLSKKTENDLKRGITVNAAAGTEEKPSQINLSFRVSIDKLPKEIYTTQMTNKATVDDVETNEVKTIVNKTEVTCHKTSTPETGSKVKAGDEITYRIEVQNTGTASADIEVQDEVPEGTTYVENSLNITRSELSTIKIYAMEDLSKGLELVLKQNEKIVIEFKVTVNQGLENGSVIRNTALVDEGTTETTEHIVKAPKFSVEKTQEVETGENYAVAGDVITYNITVKNEGELGGLALVKDTIPEGTSFVEGSIRINEQTTYTIPEEANRINSELQANTASQSTSEETNGISQNATIDLTTLTAENLQEGIEVYLAEKNDISPTTINLSFKVRVDNDKTGEIKNIATVKDEQKPEKEEAKSNETKLPVLTIEKKAEITRTTAEAQPQVEEGKVTADDEITYKIVVRNTGEEAATNVIVKDTVPEGTIIKKVNNEGSIVREKDITWAIDTIPAGEERTVSFTVTVNYIQEETKEIRNTAYIKEAPSNETVTEYQKPQISLVTEIVKDGDKKITTTEGKVYYEITYTGTINYFVGKATITIVDKLPYEIDEGNSDLDGGKYDKTNKTITWTETIEGINTYATKQAKVITKNKQISLQYIYPDEENLRGNVENTVTAKTELKEPDLNDPSRDNVVKEEEKEDNHIVVAEIPARLTVHHYFYDKERDTATTVELAPSSYGEGLIGDKYTTSKSSLVPENYECMDENPVNKEGKLTKTPIVVIYYYTLIDEEATVDVTKEASASKTVEKSTNAESGSNVETKQVEVLTQEGGAIKYKITYKAVIENYIGKAKVTIVDKLPAPINVDKSDIKGGNYDARENTITWQEEIEGIDTFAKGTFTKTIEKEISIVYEGQNKAQVLENTVEGKITTYYPDIHPEKPSGEKQNITDEDKEEVEQDYRTDVIVEKRWDDNNNIKEHRPESVRVQVTANGKTQYDEASGHNGENLPNEVLSEENGWSYTFKNLYKYDSEGNEIEYSVTESEVEENDLEYYEEAKVSKVEVTTEQEESKAETQQNAEKKDTNEVQNSKLKLIVTNTYRLTNTEIDSSITKDGTEEITSSKDEVNYHIEYHAVVKDYIGESTLTITDTLPYKIDEEKSSLKGGNYDEDTQTITWVEDLGHINTVENGEKEVSFEKDITVVYENLDASKYRMANTVKGKIEFTEDDTKNEVEDTHETQINIIGKLILKYVDITTGKVITRKIEPGEPGNEEGQEAIEVPYMYEAESKVGSQYITEKKDIPTYDYVKNSGNTVGHIIEGTIEVIYYYERSKAGDLTVRYVDEEGNDLVPEEKIEGKIEDPYKTEPKDIENYELENVTGDEPEGKLGEEPKEVVYHYKKIPAKVVVRFLEKPKEENPDTSKPTNPEEAEPKVLAPEETIEGFVGDHYETKRKAIENYKAAEPEPENSIGKMEKNDNDNTIYVTYYYEKIPSGKITIKHVDVDTDEEISYMEDGERKTYREQIQGYVGEEYKTEEKEIPYYKYVEEKAPANKEGIYKEEDDTVLYYYKKLDFNFKVDKQIRKITINGEEMEVRNNKLMKVEVVASKISSTNIELTYSIVVTNTGELSGKAQIEEIIPTGLKLSSKTPEGWQKGNGGVLLQEVELNPGESKELQIVLDWIKESDNFRNMRNEARILSTQNVANYEETNKEDNNSIAEVIISVKTGAEKKVLLIILEVIASCGALILLYEYQLYQKERNKEIRHVVLDGKNVVIVKKRQK